MKRILTIALFIMCGTCAVSAQDFTEEEKAIIERGAQLKVEAYVKKVQSECKQKAIDRALVIVDSLMRSEGLDSRIAPINKPNRPQRPTRPPVKQIPDTLKLDSVRRDGGGLENQ